MQYIAFTGGGQYPYPNHAINPEKKGREWCMQYAKAAFYDWSFVYPKGVFSNNGGDYEKFRMYALGKQPIGQYRKWLGVDEQTNNTWLSVDWSIRAIVSGYRDKSISRLMKNEMGIVATPIDMLAKSELDTYYARMKGDLILKQLAQKTGNQDIISHPLLSIKQGEPMDVEELEMRVQLGEQFNRSEDAEKAIDLGFYENNYKHFRRTLYEDLFDYGCAGYKEWLGEDNHAKFRKCFPENVIINYCRQSDFSDLIHAGEMIDVSLIDLALITDPEGNKMFDEKTLQEFAGSIAGKWGNPLSIGSGTGWLKPWDKFKCKVVDLEFETYNDYSYANVMDENGNSDFRKAEYGRGKKSKKYINKCIKFIYKVKWIVGTEYCYDWGIANDQKRTNDTKKKAQTTLSYKFYAYNFNEMRAQGFMERLIPYLDDYQLTMLKIQNFKNRAVPSGWWIDLDALENVALSKGGANMEPKELLRMFFDTGVLVGRSKGLDGNPQNPNWKPVIPIENTAASELAMFFQDLVNTITAIERMTGYNDITSGNPNPKTLVPGYETANISTNDALYPMAFAEQQLSEKLAVDVLMRMQQGVRKGEVTGYAPYKGALNTNALAFIKVSPAIADRDYGIMFQEATTDEQKVWLLQQVQQDIANGLLDTSDAILIINTHNVKQAQSILAYKVGKNKQIMQQNEMAKITANNQGAQQAAQIGQQMALQQTQMELASKEKIKMMELQAELEKTRLNNESEERRAREANLTKIEVADTTAQGKVVTQHVANTGKENQQLNK